MSDLKPNAQKDKDGKSMSVSPGRTQEPIQTHTFSLKNNAAGLSSDEHENPLNGTQPNPFVYSSVPAVPHAGNSLPSGALVNGPGSHPTSEVHCVLNKGTVLSNNVLDAAWQAEKDMSPEVLPPPSELQSDAWKNTAGPDVKTPATQPGVNTPLSHSKQNESKLAYSTLSADGAEQMHISQPLTKQTMKTRSRRDVEWLQSSSDDYDDAEVIRWDSTRERFLHNDRRLETKVMHKRDEKHNTHAQSMSGSAEKVNNSLNHTYRRSCLCSGNDVENVDIANKDVSLGTQSDIKYSGVPLKDLSRNRATDSERHIYSTAQEGSNEENDPEDEDSFSPKVEQFKTEQVEQEPLFFSRTKGNVNYMEERHFHRHMMYHLGKNNQVNSANVSQPFMCRECGRLFCDSNSLMRHIVIHQDKLEEVTEETKGLKNTEFEDRGRTVQCHQCVIGCNCPKIFVQHAKTQDNLMHYYFCEECNYISLTQKALETHLHDTHQQQYRRRSHANDEEESDRSQSRDRVAYEGNSDLKEKPICLSSIQRFADKRPSETALYYHCSGKKRAINIPKSYDKSENSSQFSGHTSHIRNTLSPSLWSIDQHGKLLLQPATKLDMATDFTCIEEKTENHNCKAFGSAKQKNCPAAADFLQSAKNPKLDHMFCQVRKKSRASGILKAKANQNPTLTRKTSTPLHKTIDNINGNILPRLSQRQKKQSADRELEKGCEGSNIFSDDTSRATGSFLESSENKRNPYARRYFKKRLRFSVLDQSPHVLKEEDGGDEDCNDIEQVIIKEEYIDTSECDESTQLPCTSTSFDIFPTPEVQHKPCPYCPASFQSGVGLSNHVRGHLHRVGLSYKARHMVSPEQVALQDCKHRSRGIPRGKMRKAVKTQTPGKHKCPLCWASFDTKTGRSNHVRGHLKRIGRSVNTTSKSLLGVLNELPDDRKDNRNILQILNKSEFSSRSFVSQRFISSKDLVLMHSGVPLKIEFESPHPIMNSFVPKQEKAFPEIQMLQVETQRGFKASQSTLVELLKMKQERETSSEDTYKTRRHDDMEEAQILNVGPKFPHGYDYKEKMVRPRPGLRKKIFSSLNAEIFTLTCRFCDLVFQGPLSIQEDWIRHLQRHLLHTSVPHSGTGMEEPRIHCTSIESHDGSEDFISIPNGSQGTIVQPIEFCASLHGNASPNHHRPTAKPVLLNDVTALRFTGDQSRVYLASRPMTAGIGSSPPRPRKG